MTADKSGPGPRYPALIQLLRAADTIWNSSHALFDKWDLSPSQFNILNLLHLDPKGLSQSELSRELLTHRSNVTGLVDRLEKRGLLRRLEVVDDRRTWRVVLTPAGTRLIREILPKYYAGAEALWDHVAENRLPELVEALTGAALNAERIAAEIRRT
jgi:MarR family 2-MHQ and catechol resistance regulon transcriptional repressor